MIIVDCHFAKGILRFAKAMNPKSKFILKLIELKKLFPDFMSKVVSNIIMCATCTCVLKGYNIVTVGIV